MSNVSPDGAWRWNGSAWEPNIPSATQGPPFVEVPARRVYAEADMAAWSHFGPLIVAGVSLLLMLSAVGSMIAWLGMFAFVVPLFIRSDQGKRSQFVYAHATESLNFQLTWLLVSVASVVLILISFGLLALILWLPLIAASVFMIVVMIKAGLAARRGEYYRYPLCIRFV